MRLRETLVAYMLPLLILPVLLFGYLAYQYSQRFWQQQTFYQVRSALATQQQQLHDFINTEQTQLQMLALNPELQAYLQTSDNTLLPALLNYWQRFSAQQPGIEAIKLVQLNGEYALHLPELNNPVAVPNRFRNEYFSPLQAMIDEQGYFLAPLPDSRERKLFFAKKLYVSSLTESRRLWGYLVIMVSPALLDNIVKSPYTSNSVSLIITKTATIAYAADPVLISSAFAPTNFRQIQQSIAADSLKSVLLLGQYRELLGVPLPGNYQLLYGLDPQQLYGEQRWFSRVLLLLMVLICLLLPLLVYWLLIKHIFSPVKQLTAAKTAVGRGDLSVLLEVKKQDELGDMFAAFNVMVRQLRVYRERERAYKQQLEDKVLRRTQDLARANDDLAGANQELILARETAEQANRLKSVFLANMSHEIRTPLTAIIGFSEQALQEDDQHKRQDYLNRVLKSGDHLLGLINDILDLSKIEADKLELNREPFDCLAAIDDIFQLACEQAQSKGLTCQLKWQFPLPQTLINDSLRFRQVLLNLSSNAVKFTQQGKVIFQVSYDQLARQLSIKVKDTGIGMNPDELARIFRPFVQADATVTRHFGGTGLGLVISKKLVEQMDGDIQVESVKGIGSCFEVILRCQHQEINLVDDYQPQQKPSENISPLPADNSVRVLVAEDNPDNQLLLKLLLEKSHATVVVVDNGHKAVERVLNDEFDLVFMDMQMPLMGGEEATRLIRHAGIEVPIIAVTANVMSEDVDRYKSAGCQALLGKPVVQSEFLALLSRFAHVRKNTENDWLQQLELDPQLQALKRQFGRQLPILIAELQQYWQAENWSALRFAAHSLKGSAGSMGYPDVTRIAGEIEQAVTRQPAAIAALLEQMLQHIEHSEPANQPDR
ncbi:histidine kinase [Arsukibacterium ikkense]|uniref:histidine kinase n=1 Tax=Arsukibacterium ikkense TaxID=336831 RepID=A0A0M2VC09_9GAMM|nr:hybrid sensor histidine kinase/response regulator [Arsukibacterium ikkense]KKO47115.1 histidine kinase [Arsukibacterium ikkense]